MIRTLSRFLRPRSRRGTTTLLATAGLLAGLAIVAGPASAAPAAPAAPAAAPATRCAPLTVAGRVCTSVTGTQVSGLVQAYYVGNRVTNVSLYVQQCDGLGHACIVITRSGNPGVYVDYQSSAKTMSHGHAYKTCATWDDIFGNHIVNDCSPFYAYS